MKKGLFAHLIELAAPFEAMQYTATAGKMRKMRARRVWAYFPLTKKRALRHGFGKLTTGLPPVKTGGSRTGTIFFGG
jgi:hypothetical protein